MSLILPSTITEDVLQWLLQTAALRLKLYSNNYTPSGTSVIGAFTEVTGGGYAAIALATGDWTITPGVPSIAVQAYKQFTFTGTTGGSGVVYGYYITNVAGTVLYGAEAFPGAISPFTPSNGAYIRVTPQVQCSGGV